MTMDENKNVKFTCGFQYLVAGRRHDRFGQDIFCYLKIGPLALSDIMKDRLAANHDIELARTRCYMDDCPIYQIWKRM